jgi:DNA invertase Pin-like site-specific DNA recombinase
MGRLAGVTEEARIGQSGTGFRSLTEAIVTGTPAGRMMIQMVGAFAEFERAMLKERTKAGLDAAREEGRIGGRCPIDGIPKFER